MASESTRSPLRQADGSAPPPPPHNTPEHPAPPPPAAMVSRDDLSAVVAKAEASAAPPGEWYSWSGQREPAAPAGSSGVWFSWTERRGATASAAAPAPADESRVVSGILRRDRLVEVVQRTAVGARLAAAALCLVAFSVLAADQDKGWALDSYNRYKQFRYCMSVNVIGFLYSGFQVYAQVHHMVTEKHIISRPMGNYFDFAMDQILAYLLISSSSSATARTDDWVSNWGRDPFPNMATGSVAVSFLAFLAFALSALISAHNVFSQSL